MVLVVLVVVVFLVSSRRTGCVVFRCLETYSSIDMVAVIQTLRRSIISSYSLSSKDPLKKPYQTG